MPSMCQICHKAALVGNNVSHANNRTKKKSHPNLQKVRAFHEGKNQRVIVCTRCLRSGKITKAA